MIREDAKVKYGLMNVCNSDSVFERCDECDEKCREYKWRLSTDIRGSHLCVGCLIESALNYIFELEAKLFRLGQLDIDPNGVYADWDLEANETINKEAEIYE